MKIYVASSWRNPHQHDVVRALRGAGHEVYDFRHPRPDNQGFSWTQVGLQRDSRGFCTIGPLIEAHAHPIAEQGFRFDFEAMQSADAFVLVLPCGRSAHLEAGWAIGQNKYTAIFMPEHEAFEPELMYKMAHALCGSLRDLLLTFPLKEEQSST